MKKIRVGKNPWTIEIAAHLSEPLGFVPNPGSSDVSVIGLDEFKTLDTIIDAGAAPTGIAFAQAFSNYKQITAQDGGTKENIFLTEEEYVNSLKWDPPSNDSSVDKYTVWRHGTHYVGSVKQGDMSNGLYEIADHNCKEEKEYTYTIRGENTTGEPIAIGIIEIITGE